MASPLVQEVGDLRERITKLYWENPSEKLTLEQVKERMHAKLGVSFSEEDLKITFDDLESKGFINKELYHPQKTKREYFWLAVFHMIASGVALIIEWVNGGSKLRSGDALYYSWDLRLGLFFLGFIFLIFYYKKYHLLYELYNENQCCNCLRCFPIVCCGEKQKPLTAMPDEVEVIKYMKNPIVNAIDDETDAKVTSVMTQTSLVDNQPFKLGGDDSENGSESVQVDKEVKGNNNGTGAKGKTVRDVAV